ncbi:hypothetical protein FRB95_004098 [Tulasnella sp. JGI-2019a]|nr:hypothetical protein FRB95_004098 [Tulasnella sp. JGI-2019a]
MDWPSVAELVDHGPWYKNRGIVIVNLCVVLALLTSYTNGFDGSMANGLQLISQWHSYFGEPEGSTLGLLTSVQNIGGFIALPLAPYVTDGLGRRKGIFLGSVIMLGGVALQAASSSVGQFIAARGMIGFGLTFSMNAAPLLVTELAYPTQRGPVTALYNVTWYIGSIISAWTTFGTFRISGSTWSWRIPSVLQALPSLLQVGLILFVPESPRWLVSKGKDEEARAVLGKYHGDGDNYHPLVEFEYSEIREAIAIEQEVGKISWLTLLQTPGNRRRMRVIVALGFAVGVTAAGTKTMINGILQVFNFVMAIGSAFFIDRIGRRRLFLISNAGMLFVFIFWTVASALFAEHASKIAANATIVMIFLYYGFYDIAWTPLLITYTIEILPFRLRAKGFAIMSFTVALALVFNQYVNPVALAKLGWKYYLFYVGWLAFELAFVWMYVWETKGRTLEQTAALFDGEEPLSHDVYVEEVVVRRPKARQLSTPRASDVAPDSSSGKGSMYEMKDSSLQLVPAEAVYIRNRPLKSEV